MSSKADNDRKGKQEQVGLDRRRLAETRKIRKAEEAKPGAVERVEAFEPASLASSKIATRRKAREYDLEYGYQARQQRRPRVKPELSSRRPVELRERRFHELLPPSPRGKEPKRGGQYPERSLQEFKEATEVTFCVSAHSFDPPPETVNLVVGPALRQAARRAQTRPAAPMD
jgi:hypothetical protein